jgi:hypothetical protein
MYQVKHQQSRNGNQLSPISSTNSIPIPIPLCHHDVMHKAATKMCCKYPAELFTELQHKPMHSMWTKRATEKMTNKYCQNDTHQTRRMITSTPTNQQTSTSPTIYALNLAQHVEPEGLIPLPSPLKSVPWRFLIKRLQSLISKCRSNNKSHGALSAEQNVTIQLQNVQVIKDASR